MRCSRRATRSPSAARSTAGRRSPRPRATSTRYAAADDRGTLDSVDAFAQGMGALPEEALARGWVDVTSVTKNLADVVQQNGGDALLEQLGTDGTFDLGVESLAAALSAEDDGVFLSVGVKTPKGAGARTTSRSSSSRCPPMRLRPSRSVAHRACSTSFGASANLDGLSKQLESVTGVSLERVFDAFSGEGARVRPPRRRAARGDGRPLARATRRRRFETVDGLMHTLAGQLEDRRSRPARRTGWRSRVVTVQGATVSYGLLDDDTVIVRGRRRRDHRLPKQRRQARRLRRVHEGGRAGRAERQSHHRLRVRRHRRPDPAHRRARRPGQRASPRRARCSSRSTRSSSRARATATSLQVSGFVRVNR